MPRYTESALREVVAQEHSLTDVLRRFGLRAAGGNYRLLRRWLVAWDISTEHFVRRKPGPRRDRIPLELILVEQSTYSRGRLKQRLYEEGLKQRQCELCGQDEQWRGQRMSLILDHINGVANDNRLQNLRIVCPNCAATLPTHCGRNLKLVRACEACGTDFHSYTVSQRHCSQACGQRSPAAVAAQQQRRVVPRPPYEALVAMVAAEGWSAVGRRYGVSDNAVRKWVRAYERERAASRGEEG